MGRLTYRLKSGATNLVGITESKGPLEKSLLRQAGWERLADYEDLLFDADGNERISLARLAEICTAEKDGRCVVLPCRVGDTVFDICDGTVYETRVLSLSLWKDGHWACRTVSSYPDVEEFGKRIFLTRPEAEAAMEGGTP